MEEKLELSPQNLLIAGFRFPHHSESSGYHHLVNYLPGTYMDANLLPLGNSAFGTKLRRINMGIFELLLTAKASNYKIYHVLYPENHILWSIPNRNQVISVVTLHLTADWLNCKNDPKNIWVQFRREAFKRLHGIIALSSAHKAELEALLPNTDVRFIPHGMNPIPSNNLSDISYENNLFRVITIGANYRDKETYFKIVQYALHEKPNWQFDLVGVPKDWQQAAKNYSNVRIHPYLVETDYFRLIEAAHVHMLPVVFATANNALLEAHAVGTPSICSNVSGITDYAVETTCFYENSYEAIKILNTIENMSIDQYLITRKKTREGGKKFLWSTIAKQVESYYHELFIKKCLDEKKGIF